MLLNAFFAWNMSAEDPILHRATVKKFAFYAVVAEEMMAYVDTEATVETEEIHADSSSNSNFISVSNSGHIPTSVRSVDRKYCVVCKLEEVWRREAGKKDDRGKNSRCQDHMVQCSNNDCQLCAHSMPTGNDRKIFQMECFQGKSCYEIAHSEECKGLWKPLVDGEVIFRTTNSSNDSDGNIRVVKAPSCAVNRSHGMYKCLATLYGKSPETRNRRRSREDAGEAMEELPETRNRQRRRQRRSEDAGEAMEDEQEMQQTRLPPPSEH